MTMSVVGGQQKTKQNKETKHNKTKQKHANPSYKATKHIERTFPISDYY